MADDPRSERHLHWRAMLTQFVVLMVFWLALSNQNRPLFWAMGVISAAVVTALTNQIVGTVLAEPGGHLLGWLRRAGWSLIYLGWMLGSITVSSVEIARMVLLGRRSIEAHFVSFETQLNRPISRTILALSITLVPGTMSVRVNGNHYLIHALRPKCADSLASGRMQTFVARITGEGPQPAPQMHWGPQIEGTQR